MLSRLFNQSHLIQKTLDASWVRNEVITNNIANVDTPGYKSKSVAFEREFREALLREPDNSLPRQNISLRRLSGESAIQAGPDMTGRVTRDKHFNFRERHADPLAVQPSVYTNRNTNMKMDGNNVDVESELNEAAKNTLFYYTMLNKVSSDLGRLRTTLRDIR